MRNQTQTRHSGYISPKCRTIRLDAGYCFEGSIQIDNGTGLQRFDPGVNLGSENDDWGY